MDSRKYVLRAVGHPSSEVASEAVSEVRYDLRISAAKARISSVTSPAATAHRSSTASRTNCVVATLRQSTRHFAWRSPLS